MPGALAITCCRGEVMKAWTVSGLAPGYAVLTVTTVVVTVGYSRTVMPSQARKPKSRITRLTALANTGRRMKMSVNFMCTSGLRLQAIVDGNYRTVAQFFLPCGDHGIAGLHTRGNERRAVALVRDLHHALLHHGLAVVRLDHKHIVAEGVVADGGIRHHHAVQLMAG